MRDQVNLSVAIKRIVVVSEQRATQKKLLQKSLRSSKKKLPRNSFYPLFLMPKD